MGYLIKWCCKQQGLNLSYSLHLQADICLWNQYYYKVFLLKSILLYKESHRFEICDHNLISFSVIYFYLMARREKLLSKKLVFTLPTESIEV